MRSIYYMKLDYVLTRQQFRILPLLALVGLLLGKQVGGMEGGIGALSACSYLLFICTVYATAPFGSCQRKDAGFLLMLPGTVMERVAGRFLYGLTFFGIVSAVCIVFLGTFSLMGYEISPMAVELLLCQIAVSLLIVTMEYMLSYIFGEGKGNWQYLSNIIRVLPGMAMFFAFIYLIGAMEKEPYAMDRMSFLMEVVWLIGPIAIAASLLIMAAAVIVCVKVIGKRDYV